MATDARDGSGRHLGQDPAGQKLDGQALGDDIPSTQAPRVVYGLDYHKHGQGGHHRGRHHRSDPTSSRRQHHSSHRHHHHHRSRRQRRRTGLAILAVVVAVVVALGLSGMLLYRSAMTVADDAGAFTSNAATVEQALATGDAATAQSAAATLSASAESMRSETEGVLWVIGSHLPIVGQDLYNVRTLARAVDEVSSGVLVPLAQQADSLSLSNLLSDGKVDVDMLQTLGDTFASSKEELQAVTTELDESTPGSIEAVNEALDSGRESVDEINALVQGIGTIGPHASQILGGDGQTRHYVVVAMGNSEIRSAGGFAGSYGLLTITDGQIELGEFESIQSNTEYNGVDLTQDELNYLGDVRSQMVPDAVPGDATFNPNFPRTCDFIIANWDKVYEPDYTVDGVLAADPQFVQDMLAITGGVTTSDGATVDGTNAAKYLLSDVYWTWPNDGEKQDSAFSEVANLAFSQVLGGLDGSNLLELGSTIGDDIHARNLNLWFADDDVQQALSDMGVSNGIDADPTDYELANPEVGIYFYDITYGKIEWYLNAQTYIGTPTQNSDGTLTYPVSTTLKNEITTSEAAQAPRYVLGQRYRDTAQDGTIGILVDFVAPAGGTIELEDSSWDLEQTTFMNRTTYRNFIEISPQDQGTVTYTVTVPAQATSELGVDMTPTCQQAAGWK